jgi:hypothetical protein
MCFKFRVIGIALIAVAVGMLLMLLLPKACLSFILAGIILAFGLFLVNQYHR